jgi:uncharacterized protein DUF3597
MSIGICLNVCRDSATSATEARLATLDCRFDEAHQSGQQPYRTQRAGTGTRYTGDMNDSASMNIWLHKQVMTKLAENGVKPPTS